MRRRSPLIRIASCALLVQACLTKDVITHDFVAMMSDTGVSEQTPTVDGGPTDAAVCTSSGLIEMPSAGGARTSTGCGSGSLDPTFGTDGIAWLDLGVRETYVADIITATTGVLLGGVIDDATTILRLDAQGQVDRTFDPSGTKTIQTFENARVQGFARTANQDILVLTTGFIVERLLGNGELDPSFGRGGFKRLDVGEIAHVEPVALVVGLDGGFAALALADLEQQLVTAKLDPRGVPDTRYGSEGVSVGPQVQHPLDVAVQSDGKVLVAGAYGDQPYFILRLTESGSNDPSFGNGGRVEICGVRMFRLAIQPDGWIVGVGQNVSGHGVIARFDPQGRLDPAFGHDGISELALGFWLVALQSDGKIVVAGVQSDGWIVGRVDSTGHFDSTFGMGGVQSTHLGPPADVGRTYGVRAMKIASTGNIIVSGATAVGNTTRTIVARYCP
jgi:uncharacterized delta-60 repeat protein